MPPRKKKATEQVADDKAAASPEPEATEIPLRPWRVRRANKRDRRKRFSR